MPVSRARAIAGVPLGDVAVVEAAGLAPPGDPAREPERVVGVGEHERERGGRDVDDPQRCEQRRQLGGEPAVAVPDVAAQCLDRVGELAAHAGNLDHERLLVGIGKHDPAARPGDAEQLVERPHRIGEVHQDPIGPAPAEGRVGERELLGEPLADAPDARERPRAHRPRSIDADRLLRRRRPRRPGRARSRGRGRGSPLGAARSCDACRPGSRARRRRAPASRPRLADRRCGRHRRKSPSRADHARIDPQRAEESFNGGQDRIRHRGQPGDRQGHRARAGRGRLRRRHHRTDGARRRRARAQLDAQAVGHERAPGFARDHRRPDPGGGPAVPHGSRRPARSPVAGVRPPTRCSPNGATSTCW